MKNIKFSKIAAASVASLLGLAMVVTVSVATTPKNENKILDKVSTEGNAAMQDLRWARVALFDGQPEAAQKYLDKAKTNLAKAEKQAPELVVTINSQQKVGDKIVASKRVTESSDYVPVDAWLTLSDDFVATPEKSAKIKEANGHIQNGDKKKAVEVLKTADIAVSIGRALIPLKATIKDVDSALALMNDHKYYEANLVLKGAEDGVVVDSVLLVEPVTSGTNNAINAKPDTKAAPTAVDTRKNG
ncbi:MAG: YfdX family protein [Desulfopila sp.]